MADSIHAELAIDIATLRRMADHETAFANLEFWLYVAADDLRAFLVNGKRTAGARVRRGLQLHVTPALETVATAIKRGPMPRGFPSREKRILRADTHTAFKDLPASYRGMLRTTFALGDQLEGASKRGVRATAAQNSLATLNKHRTSLAALLEG